MFVLGVTRHLLASSAFSRAQDLAQRARPLAKKAQEAMRPIPADSFVALFYSPEKQAFFLETLPDGHPGVSEFRQRASAALGEATGCPVLGSRGGIFPEEAAPVLYAPDWNFPGREKRAYSNTLRNLGKLILAFPSRVSQNIPYAGSPLAMLLAGGLLGAGLGYGGGWLAETVLPAHWRRNRLRRTTAILGALGGMVPGGLGWLMNIGQGKGILQPTSWYVPAPDEMPAGETKLGAYLPGPVASLERFCQQEGDTYWHRLRNVFRCAVPHIKAAAATGVWSSWEVPIPVPELQHTLWNDPHVANRLYPSQQAALSGTLMGASLLAGNPSAGIGASVVTPGDMARMTAGMGSGYLSGMLVGKALGVLTGMPQETQDTLKRTGVYAGILANLAPKLFGL